MVPLLAFLFWLALTGRLAVYAGYVTASGTDTPTADFTGWLKGIFSSFNPLAYDPALRRMPPRGLTTPDTPGFTPGNEFLRDYTGPQSPDLTNFPGHN